MATFIILVTYLAFISLGLPDTLLGSAWPVMQIEFGMPLDAEGIVILIVSIATIFSCLANGFLVRKLGTARITALSCAFTAVAILGYSQSPSFGWLLVLSIPLGLGAGSVDTCLNNYGAMFMTTRQVNWQHCCYALGAAAGPLIMSVALARDNTWRDAYLVIAIIQIVIAVILFISIPLWKERDYRGDTPEEQSAVSRDAGGKKKPLLLIPGVAMALLSYMVFYAVECGTALWAPSYLVSGRGLSPDVAARIVFFYYIFIMIGRFVCGFLAAKLSDRGLIRLGIAFCIGGTIMLGLDLPQNMYYAAIACVGFGCAPVIPSLIHLTPIRFGRENSQRVMGVQMAAGNIGTAFVTPCIGLVADGISIYTIPWFIMILAIIVIVLSEVLDRVVLKNKR